MSLFVIGLDVPKSCYDCVQNDKGDNGFYLLSNCQVWIEEICKGNIYCEDLPKDHRDITCPLSEIPTPHGRLIDADRLLAVLKSMASTNQSVPTEAVLDLIDHQPVIIEEERIK